MDRFETYKELQVIRDGKMQSLKLAKNDEDIATLERRIQALDIAMGCVDSTDDNDDVFTNRQLI